VACSRVELRSAWVPTRGPPIPPGPRLYTCNRERGGRPAGRLVGPHARADSSRKEWQGESEGGTRGAGRLADRRVGRLGGEFATATVHMSHCSFADDKIAKCYMAPHEGEEDPAVYRSGTSKKRENGEDGAGKDKKDGDEMDQDAEGSDEENDEDEDEDGTLLTVQPAFNRLLLTLRDARVLHFVKYVSAAAHGSRWDIAGEWEIGQIADSDEDDDHDHEE